MTLVKIEVCRSCLSPEIIDSNCICTYQNDYTTIELEFEQCDCCERTNSHAAETDFNNKQFENE